MSKSYWHSVGSGALGMTGPWNSPEGQARRERGPLRRLLAQSALASLLIAFFAGGAISIYQHFCCGNPDAWDTASIAYQFTGAGMSAFVTGIMRLIGLQGQAATLQDYLLFYLEIPYQICAFAGACVATTGVELVTQVIAGLTLQR